MTGIERLQNLKKKIPKPKKKIDLIVRGVLIYWVIFVCVAWITFWIKDSVPDTLVQYGLSGGGLELILTAIIEIARDRYAPKDPKETE